jgi:hypothetical protein
MNPPKLFISYSWSGEAHEQLVLRIATELRESGVDVILDKWDLKEGHDAFAFMEQMVTDPEIKKVAIVCDEKYAAKADGRLGGVGTETQIISKEVYENQRQEKFVAIVTARDKSGAPFLPAYYRSRIFIDLSDDDLYVDNFERLLRWIFDKPLNVKPEIGSRPAYLSEDEHLSLGTTAIFRRCIDAMRNQQPFAAGAFDQYCALFALNLERFRLVNPEGEFDDAVIKNIESFLPYRNEAIQLFTVIAQYSQSGEITNHLHRFLESLIPYTMRQAHVSQWKDSDFDNFRFIVHELYLYALAILLRHERISQATYLLEQQYYVYNTGGREPLVSFEIFRHYLPSLDKRNKRLGLSQVSLCGTLLKERCPGTGIDFRHLMQADFVAFIRAELAGRHWFPETLVYLGDHFYSGPFEIFARCRSKAYFDKAKALLGIESSIDILPFLKRYRDGSRSLSELGLFPGVFNPAALLGFEHLATLP